MPRKTKAIGTTVTAIVTLMLVVLMLPWAATAQAPAQCETNYVVQAGDWLAKIAHEQYGDYSLYPAIVLATNAQSATDSSDPAISDPWVIEPGWKLCIPDATTAGAGITIDKLMNAEYLSEWTAAGVAPLVDGEYSESAAPGSATKTVVTLTDRMAYGYLDGGAAAATILVTNPGGSGTFYNLSLVTEQGGALTNVATTLLGDRVRINSLAIKDGKIAIDMITHGPEDPLCCPTQQVAQVYALEGDEIVLLSSEVIGKVESEDKTAPALTLESTLWTLDSYLNSDGNLVSILPGSEITAEFIDGQVAGSAGCNRYFSAYERSGNILSFGIIGSTEMFCMAEGLMEQEMGYLAALSQAASHQIADGVLTISDGEGNTLLTFSEVEPAPLTGTTWILTGYNNGEGGVTSLVRDTEITAIFTEDGIVTGSAGCNSYNGGYSIEDGAISFGPAATTRMACGSPEGIMEQESAYLAALEAATTYQINGDTLELAGADGERIATFVAQDMADKVAGIIWKWQGTQTPVEQVTVEDPDQYTIQFMPDGALSIKADCNASSGTYTLDNGSVEITLGPTTLAACGPDSLSDRFLKELGAAAIIFFDGDDLMIDLFADSGTMRFARGE